MKIAILGSGTIGATLARRWTEAGHSVVYGARAPHSDRYRGLAAETAVATIADAVNGADAVFIAIPGNSVEDLLRINRGALDGALLLDATNNTAGGSFHQLPLFEALVPGARVYRAFNTLGWENFADPIIDGERGDLFYAGPEGEDQQIVEELIDDVGLRPMYVGSGADGADLLDGLTRLWFTLALRLGHGRRLQFRTLGLSHGQDKD